MNTVQRRGEGLALHADSLFGTYQFMNTTLVFGFVYFVFGSGGEYIRLGDFELIVGGAYGI